MGGGHGRYGTRRHFEFSFTSSLPGRVAPRTRGDPLHACPTTLGQFHHAGGRVPGHRDVRGRGRHRLTAARANAIPQPPDAWDDDPGRVHGAASVDSSRDEPSIPQEQP
ncbi:hypothetical protein RAJCM14343_2655 [Rhodococcus aetherivorans]|uniref:Uncharacterized protein n=1 Tax=Rhodococcus aetherivorans TaxID=191292 RepID=A0ABQ0YLF2_9NOCA|nr:hypothetical protein RAJCM14343_2655 [Rhodococcus aetherivorans]